jgi:hypothetical protein
MTGLAEQRARRSPRSRIAAAFIEWVGGAAAFGGLVPVFYGWGAGAPYFLGALLVGVLGFLAHVAYIRYTGA